MEEQPFILYPDYHTLIKYFPFEETAEQLQLKYANGFEYWVYFYDTTEEIERITTRFKDITEKYNLSGHYDNLLLLSLYRMNLTEAALYELRFQNDQQVRTKELAQLLLTYKESERKRFSSLHFKTLTGAAKLTDGWAMEWLLSLADTAIAQGKFPIGGFEFNLNERFHDADSKGKKVLSTDKLKMESLKHIVPYKRMVKSYHADFCLFLYKYLDIETDIRPDKTKLFSDAQLNFFFDVMILLEMINTDQIESEPKDYISTMLRNRVKILNH